MKASAPPAMDFKLASSLTGPFTAIARAMSGQWGINVIPNGFRCMTDGKKNIWIPFAADHLGEEGRRALHGMLDHEVCHVVEETEHEKAGRAGYGAVAKMAKNKTLAMLLNVVEDIRIERKWEVRYPGVAKNLMDCHTRVMELNRRDWGKAKRNFWDAFGLALFSKARNVPGDISFVGEKALKALDECEEELKGLDTLEWIQDSYDLAERLWNKINRDAEETLERAKKAKKPKKPAKEPKEEAKEEEKTEKPEPGDEGEEADEGKPGDEPDDAGKEGGADEEGEEPTAGGEDGEEDSDEDDLDGEDEDEDLDSDDDEGEDDDGGADGGDGESKDGDDSDGDEGEGEGDGASSDDEGAGDEADGEETDEDEASGTGGGEADEDLDGEEGDDEDASGGSGGGSGEGADDGPSDEEIEAAKEILAGAEGEGSEGAEAEGSVAVVGPGGGEEDEEEREPPTPEELAAAREILETVAGVEDFVRVLADELEKEAREDARAHKLYIPDPTMRKLDKWFKPEPLREREETKEQAAARALANYMAAKADVDSQIGAIRGKQLAFIQTITRKRLITGQDAGMLDQAALSTVRTGSLDVFADIKKGIALDTAIEVLLDLSGSMGYGDAMDAGGLGFGGLGGRAVGRQCPAYYCKRIAIALVEAWEPLRIPNEFIGFTNNHSRAVGAPDPDAVRRAPFDFHVFKAWGERLKFCRERFSTICGHDDNADGEAVLAAAQRLALRPEKRKLLVVISDGYPAHAGIGGNVLNEHLKETVKKITRAGMEVLGVGAGTDAPERFYNKTTGAKNLIINDLNTLAPRLFKTLRESILK